MRGGDDEEYTYASIATRRKRERASVALMRLPDDFYERVDAYLRGLREEYQREHATNPATPKVLILQDELVKLQEAREDVYDMRERKILNTAVVAARGGNPDRSHLTTEEEVLFDEVLRVLREARRNLLRRGAAPPREAAPKPAGGPPTAPEPAPMPAFAAQPAAVLAERPPAVEAAPESPLPGKPPAPPAPPAVAAEAVSADEEPAPPRRLGPARLLVRMRQAVEPFVGPDLRQYRLGAEDVAAVPKDVAHVLIQRQLAIAIGG